MKMAKEYENKMLFMKPLCIRHYTVIVSGAN